MKNTDEIKKMYQDYQSLEYNIKTKTIGEIKSILNKKYNGEYNFLQHYNNIPFHIQQPTTTYQSFIEKINDNNAYGYIIYSNEKINTTQPLIKLSIADLINIMDALNEYK